MWRQCLVAGFPAHVLLSPELEGGSSFATRTGLLVFSSHKWSGIINKSAASLNWQRARILIAVPPYIWSEMLRWWKAYSSVCVCVCVLQCQGISLCSPSAAELSTGCPSAARLGSSPGSQGILHTSAPLAPGLHREQALALVRSEPLLWLFRIQHGNSSWAVYNCLPLTCRCINWLQSLSIQNLGAC